MGIFSAIFGTSGNGLSASDQRAVDAFHRTGRGSARAARLYAQQHSGAPKKSLWKQSQEHKRNGGQR